MRIILITGISGSGKSVALNMLEDHGYYCVDNLPTHFLPELVNWLRGENLTRLAVAIDVRSLRSLEELPVALVQLKEITKDVRVIFLTANTASLVQRFSETRRPHPLSHRLNNQANTQQATEKTLLELIEQERSMLVPLQNLGHRIDTSGLASAKLRHWIKDLAQIEEAPLTILFESFAFKYGVPLDADIVFDARLLPNPYYDPLLRPLTGKDAAVVDFFSVSDEASAMLFDIRSYLEKWLPSFKKEGRAYLTVAIGCTGGQHRSVYLVQSLYTHFLQTEQTLVRHRELTSS